MPAIARRNQDLKRKSSSLDRLRGRCPRSRRASSPGGNNAGYIDLGTALIGPWRGNSIPAVLLEFLKQLRIKGSGIACIDILADMFGLAHADDGRANGWVRENEAQRQLGERHRCRQNSFQFVDSRQRCCKILLIEIPGAPIAFRKFCVEREFAAKAAFVERNAGDDADILFATEWIEFVFRRLIEDVVDDLD